MSDQNARACVIACGTELSTMLVEAGFSQAEVVVCQPAEILPHVGAAPGRPCVLVIEEGDWWAQRSSVRAARATCSSLVITAGGIPERVRLLLTGADDCLSLPLDARELAARVHALARRTRWVGACDGDSVGARGQGWPLKAGMLLAGEAEGRRPAECQNPRDERQRDAHAGSELRLSKTDRALLAYVAARPGQVVSSEELFRAAWGERRVSDPANLVCVHMTRIRRRLEAASPAGPCPLQTIWGVGYRWNA